MSHTNVLVDPIPPPNALFPDTRPPAEAGLEMQYPEGIDVVERIVISHSTH